MTVLCAVRAAAGSLEIVAVVVRRRTAFLDPTSGPAQSASGKFCPVATPTLFQLMPCETPYSATAFAVAYRLEPESLPSYLAPRAVTTEAGTTLASPRIVTFSTPVGTEKAPLAFERMRTMPLAYMIGEEAKASGQLTPVPRNTPSKPARPNGPYLIFIPYLPYFGRQETGTPPSVAVNVS